MEDPLPQQQYQIEFEKNTAPFTKNYKGKARHFFQDTPNPFLLDASDNIPRLYFVRNQVISKLKYDNSEKCFVGDATRKPFQGYDNYEPDEESELHCVKVSPCQRYLAAMTGQYIWIYTIAPNFGLLKVGERNVDFRLEGSQFDDYMSIQWPPLSASFLQNPYFFSMDSANKIRLHYIKDNTTVVPKHEELRCANFSHDGERILGINLTNELCFMDRKTLETLYKKTIPELNFYENAHVAHVFQIDRNHIAIGAFCSLPGQDNSQLYKKFQSIVFILSGDFMALNGEIRTHGYQMDATYEILEDFYSSFKFQFLKEQSILLYTHSDSPDIYTLYFGKNGNMIQFPTISLDDGTVRGFVLLKSLLTGSTKKRKMQLDGKTKVTVLPKISVIILTSEGRFLQYDLKEICPEKDPAERKIRKICTGKVLSEGLKEEGEKQEKEEKEGGKPVEKKNDYSSTILNGHFTLGPRLFMKLEHRPNLFAKVEEAKTICFNDDDEEEEKDLKKKAAANPRAFNPTVGNENKGAFAMFKKEDPKEENKSGLFKVNLFGGKENDCKLANRGAGLFSAVSGKENAEKKNEGRSELFGDFKIQKKEEIK